MDITIVLIDNGDTEPEVWGFRYEDDAEAFIAARGGGQAITVAVMGYGEARQLIESERA